MKAVCLQCYTYYVMAKDLKDYTRAELEQILLAIGESKVHARQLFVSLYRENATTFSAISGVPQRVTDYLCGITSPAPAPLCEKLVSKLDGTIKLLFRFPDGAPAESVILFSKGRASLCLSSQSGCACGCGFCATGGLGLRRNLMPHEILGQFSACLDALGGVPGSIVFMGMGEPFLNWENVKKSILILSDGKGYNFPQSKITVSTVGIIPVIRELAVSDLKIRLAISVITADEKQRARFVPMNEKFPLPDIISAARYYCEARKRQVFCEYILFGGLNDSPADAEKLAELVKGLDCKINLIAYNSSDGKTFVTVSAEKAKAFQKLLMAKGLITYLRREKGSDILAACGQLAAKRPG